MDQRDLVDRAKRGDHEAFAMLVGATIARLDAAARLILRDQALDQVMLDPVDGTSRTLPWLSVSLPSWQRLAP